MRITSVVGLMSIVFPHALSLHALADDATTDEDLLTVSREALL